MAIKVGTVRSVVCASPVYLARHGTPVAPEDLGKHQCISFTGLGNPNRWPFGAEGAEKSVTVQARLSVNTGEAAIDAAIAGLGLTRVLSYQIAAAQSSGDLVTVLQTYEPTAVPISLVYNGQGVLPLKLRAFMDFAAQRLKARLLPRAEQPQCGKRV